MPNQLVSFFHVCTELWLAPAFAHQVEVDYVRSGCGLYAWSSSLEPNSMTSSNVRLSFESPITRKAATYHCPQNTISADQKHEPTRPTRTMSKPRSLIMRERRSNLQSRNPRDLSHNDRNTISQPLSVHKPKKRGVLSRPSLSTRPETPERSPWSCRFSRVGRLETRIKDQFGLAG